MKRIFLSVGTLLLCLTTRPQNKPLPIAINSILPDTEIIETAKEKAIATNLGKYKGKWLLLDFWSVNCKSCLAKLPLLDSLQKELASEIRVLLVTKDTKEQGDQLFAKIKLKKPDLPIVYADTILHRYFPHNTVPHHVWIDPGGSVRYITDAAFTTRSNIQKMLEGNTLNVQQKREVGDFDRGSPLLTEGGGRLLHQLRYYSLVMDKLQEYGGSYSTLKKDSLHQKVSLRFVNQTLLTLYRFAFGEKFKEEYLTSDIGTLLPKSRVIIEGDTSLTTKLKKSYCYESLAALNRESNLFRYMQEDLVRNFPVRGIIEWRKQACVVITHQKTKAATVSTMQEAGTKYQTSFSDKRTLTTFLANYYDTQQLPVVCDGTVPATLSVSIHLRSDFKEVDLLNELRYSGIRIKKEVREIPMLIIKE